MYRLLLQLAKWKVVRNLAVAFIIAAGVTAIGWIVNWKAHSKNDNGSAPPIQPIVSAISTTATAPAPPDKPADSAAAPRYKPEKIPAPDYAEEINAWRLREREGNVVLIESNAIYTHYLVLMGETRRTHNYVFKYKCGCTVMTTPDPYGDVIYAEPERVAELYSSRMCASCTKLQQVLDENATDDTRGDSATN